MAKRSRVTLGVYTSAALPLLWAEKQRRELSSAALARELGVNGAMAAKLLYGERRAGRDLAVRCLKRFKVPIEAWGLPLPANWAPPELPEEQSKVA